MTGRLGGRTRVASRPASRLAFRPVKSAAPVGCLSEGFGGNTDTDIGTDLAWNVYKTTFSDGGAGIGSGSVRTYNPDDSPLAQGMGVQSGGVLYLKQPTALTSRPIGTPVFPVYTCDVDIGTAATLTGDVTVTGTVGGVGPGGTGAGQFNRQDFLVLAQGSGVISNAEYGYVFWVGLNLTGLVRFYQLSVWTGGSSYFGGALTDTFTDIFYGSPSIALAATDTLTMEVTGSTALTRRVVCKHNTTTVIDFDSWADFVTDNGGMTSGDLPGGAHHGLSMFAKAGINGGAYWTGLHDDVVGFSNFSACPL